MLFLLYPTRLHPRQRPILTVRCFARSSPAAVPPSPTPWALELVEALQTETIKYNWSQVWRCRARKSDGTAEAVDVVVKLLHESLFSLPTGGGSHESDRWEWWSAEWLEKREASNYALLNDFQGPDIPICYGFYHFDLPHGERVVGLVLEDLSAIARTLGDFLLRERTAKNDELGLEDGLDNLFTPALQAVRRFHNRGIVYLDPQSDDILVLKGYGMRDGPLPLIFLDLAHTSSRAQAEESIRRADKRIPRVPVNGVLKQPRHWRSNDEAWMEGLIRAQTGFEGGRAWAQMEAERGLLGLWRDTWWKV